MVVLLILLRAVESEGQSSSVKVKRRLAHILKYVVASCCKFPQIVGDCCDNFLTFL